MPEIRQVIAALAFAARAHANQRRKGAAQEPYVNHLIEVADLVAEATEGADADALIAALLHDVAEDCGVSHAQLADSFGAEVARLVAECSDDMSLPKDERRRARIAAAPPAGWPVEWRLGYLEGCRALAAASGGASAVLDARFAAEAAEAERLIRADAAPDPEGRRSAIAELDAAAGDPVHLVYLANTERRVLGPDDVDRFCDRVARSFPSAVIQRAEAIYDGARRPILMARIRTVLRDAVVALAQRLCLDFEQRFVGVEVEGRYIRIYADDTG